MQFKTMYFFLLKRKTLTQFTALRAQLLFRKMQVSSLDNTLISTSYLTRCLITWFGFFCSYKTPKNLYHKICLK